MPAGAFLSAQPNGPRGLSVCRPPADRLAGAALFLLRHACPHPPGKPDGDPSEVDVIVGQWNQQNSSSFM